ncbi:uncharacterized protein [Haliotis cracherodii]|uniref:uncharacterized protein n=1 Tax=Haliotis cracherodii TaxID=6455 RepID=UPI0039E7DEF5
MTMQRRKPFVLMMLTGACILLILEHVVLPPFTSMMGADTTSRPRKTWEKIDWAQPRSSSGKTQVYRFNGSQMQKLHEFCTWTVHLDCVPLRTSSGAIPIHIHDVVVDRFVSKTLKEVGTWEPENIDLIGSELNKDPELGFMDLGSHVGAYSLSVAKFGRKVVSVDPLIENVQRLCKSIQKGGYTDRMTIIFNPLGANNSLVNFKREVDNVGGTNVVASSGSSPASPCEESADSFTITLDDTLPYLPFKKAVIKMDIQEYEYYVISGAKRFFKEIDVPAILMEWVLMKSDVNGNRLVDLLLSLNYSAYEPRIGGEKLDPKLFKTWPYDVIWKK